MRGRIGEQTFSVCLEIAEGQKTLHNTTMKKDQQPIGYAQYIETPIGTTIACGDTRALSILEFVDRFESEGSCIARLQAAGYQSIVFESTPPLDRLTNELNAYFARSLTEFSVPLAPVGTPFQQSVWNTLQEIPYGQTWSYAALARTLGNLKAIRAVGRANGQNPIAIVIPCHRVIGSDGKLIGYAGGLERKRTLLTLEGASAPLPEGQERLL